MATPSKAQRRELVDAILGDGKIRPYVNPRTAEVLEREGWVEERPTEGFYKYALFVTDAGRAAVGMPAEPDAPEVGGGEVLVYRVETADGRGPYNIISGDPRKYALLREMRSVHDGSPNHPSAWQDGVGDDNGLTRGHVFGFASKESLANWFAGWAERLAHAGYAVKTYAVNREYVLFGSRQVAFFKSEARPLIAGHPSAYFA